MTDNTPESREPGPPLAVPLSDQLGAGADARYLASDQRTPGRPRFTVQEDGRWIDDDDFIFDCMLKISGDFAQDDRKQFAQWVCDALNEADKKLPREPRGA
jgi:hypothetical protein